MIILRFYDLIGFLQKGNLFLCQGLVPEKIDDEIELGFHPLEEFRIHMFSDHVLGLFNI
jgi:hypothetical protein